MNKNQEIKMQLLESFGVCDDKKTVDFCREAFRFLMEGEGQDGTSPACQAQYGLQPVPSDPVAVDLGLPSGTLWADRNVGAKSPVDNGAFFSWGNTDPHFPQVTGVDWGYAENAFDYEFTSEEYEKTPGYQLDGDIDLEHDAARVNMGEPWQMPSKGQFQELYDNCVWTRRTLDGVNGYEVKSKVNGNSIFLACSGGGYGSSWSNRALYGGFWSRSLHSQAYGRRLCFSRGGVYPQDYNNRYYGFVVRAVQTSSPKE